MASNGEDDEAKGGGGGGGGGQGGEQEEGQSKMIVETKKTAKVQEGTPAAKEQSTQPSVASPRSGLTLFLTKEAGKIADSLGRGAQARSIKDACRELQGTNVNSASHVSRMDAAHHHE